MVERNRPDLRIRTDKNSAEPLSPPHEESSQYNILSGYHDRFRGKISGESLRAYYVYLTDNLIQRAICGSGASTVDTTNFNRTIDDVIQQDGVEKLKPYYDAIIFLDKSARPVEWLFKALWDHLSKMPDGTKYEIPERLFVNIDRIFWSQHIDPENIGNREIDQHDIAVSSMISRLRAVFEKSNVFQPDQNNPDQSDHDSHKKILIVDEVRSTGRTLAYTSAMFKAAFPNIQFEGHHWMGSVGTNGFTPEGDVVIGDAGVPVWYSDKTILGRGVGDPERHKHRIAGIGLRDMGRAYFLSTRLSLEDRRSSDQLREEMAALAKDVIDHKILVRPSFQYNTEVYLTRAQQLNPGHSNVDDLAETLKRMGNEWTIKRSR